MQKDRSFSCWEKINNTYYFVGTLDFPTLLAGSAGLMKATHMNWEPTNETGVRKNLRHPWIEFDGKITVKDFWYLAGHKYQGYPDYLSYWRMPSEFLPMYLEGWGDRKGSKEK